MDIPGSRAIPGLLPSRYAVIGMELDAGDADVVCFQEVFTYWQLRLPARRMISFHHVSYRPSPIGPGSTCRQARRHTASISF
jgi:hypothetical protein